MGDAVITLSIYRWSITQLERFARTRYWAAATIALILLVGLLVQAFPTVYSLTNPSDTYAAVFRKAGDLTRDLTLDYAPESNMAKQNFRLVMPVLAAVFRFSAVGLYGVQVAFGIGILYLTLRLTERLTQDRVTAILVTVIAGTIYAGANGYLETNGRFDAPSIFLLLLALYVRNPLIIAGAVFLAGWNDERGVVAAALVFAFHFTLASDQKPGSSLATLVRTALSPQPLAVIAGGVLYLASRLAFAAAFHISTPPVYPIEHIIANRNWWGFGAWTALEGGWLLAIAVCLLVQRKQILHLLMLLGAIGAVLFAAFAVVDISRSTSYALPALFLAVYVIYRQEGQRSARALAFAAAVIAALWPMYYLENGAMWIRPLILRVIA